MKRESIATIISENNLSHEEKLQQIFGFSSLIICDVMRSALNEVSLLDENHPKTTPGMRLYEETVRYLRNALAPFGWERERFRGMELVRKKDGLLAIAVIRGCVHTGVIGTGISPRSETPRGTTTDKLVRQNQLKLFPELAEPFDEADGPVVWVLLHHVGADRARMEISLPQKIDSSKYIDTWAERIIIPEVEFKQPLDITYDDSDEDSVELDVPVIRNTTKG